VGALDAVGCLGRVAPLEDVQVRTAWSTEEEAGRRTGVLGYRRKHFLARQAEEDCGALRDGFGCVVIELDGSELQVFDRAFRGFELNIRVKLNVTGKWSCIDSKMIPC